MNYLKKISITFTFLFCMFCFPIISNAAIVEEVEPNNTPMEAQEIQRNLMTPDQLPSGNFRDRNSTKGILSPDDPVDWYKVLLYTDKENLWDIVMNNSAEGSVALEVYDADGERVGGNNFVYTKGNPECTFRIEVPSTGVYYLKVSNLTIENEKKYTITVGNPLYIMTSYTEILPSVTLGPSLPPYEQRINLTNMASLPNRSMVFEVNIGGGTTGTTSSRRLHSDQNSRWLTALNSVWTCSVPVTNDYILKQGWTVQYNGGTKNATITPEIRFRYVYPRLPLNEQF